MVQDIITEQKVKDKVLEILGERVNLKEDKRWTEGAIYYEVRYFSENERLAFASVHGLPIALFYRQSVADEITEEGCELSVFDIGSGQKIEISIKQRGEEKRFNIYDPGQGRMGFSGHPDEFDIPRLRGIAKLLNIEE